MRDFKDLSFEEIENLTLEDIHNIRCDGAGEVMKSIDQLVADLDVAIGEADAALEQWLKSSDPDHKTAYEKAYDGARKLHRDYWREWMQILSEEPPLELHAEMQYSHRAYQLLPFGSVARRLALSDFFRLRDLYRKSLEKTTQAN